MTHAPCYVNRFVAGLLLALGGAFGQNTGHSAETHVLRHFVGSTPCGTAIRSLLGIPADAKAHLVEWRLTLRQDSQSREPAGYELRCDFGVSAQGAPRLSKTKSSLTKEGRWAVGRGTKADPDAVVYELEGGLALFRLDNSILHILNGDRNLMIGTSGWSYTLYRADACEKPGDLALVLSRPSVSYSLSPLATGPGVFGVFEGRSPGRGIARLLKLPEEAGGIKVKWRVTLYQDPATLAPTTYKIESSLHRERLREGKWTIVHGIPSNPKAIMYRLEPTDKEPALMLLRGDDDVLFFLDENRVPMVGHAEFSYTLNRRETNPDSASAK